MRRLVVALLPGVLGACALLVDTDGLSDGSSDAAPPGDALSALDASMDTNTSFFPPSDAESDAGSNDATSNDAGTDAAASPCTVTHLFCDDFDTGALLNRWDTMAETAGPLAFDSMLFVSPSRSLLATVTPAAGSRSTFLRKAVAVPANKVRVELDFRTTGPSAGVSGFVEAVSLELYPPPAGYKAHNLGLNDLNASSRWEYFVTPTVGGAQEILTSILFPRGRWVHIVLEADFTKSPARSSLSIDGVTYPSRDLFGSSLTSVLLSVGPGDVSEANVTWPLSYDNVTVDP